MATVAYMSLALGGCWLAGMPLMWLCKGRRPADEVDWLLAPFLGISGVIVVLYNFVYLDCTITRATPWVWLFIAAGWLILLLARGADGKRLPPWRAEGALRISLETFPSRVFLATIAVYCIQGLGLLIVGTGDYMARAWCDEFGYVSATQFLMDVPYSTSWSGVGQKAYLVEGILLKTDRLGVEMVHGFFAATAGESAKNLFGPTILLGPALLVPAVYLLCRKLGRGASMSLAAGVGAGLLPALTTLHLYCFMAQTVSVPLLLVNLVTLHEVATEPSRGRFLRAALLLAATLALYAELMLLLAGLMLVCGVGGLLLRTVRLRGLACLVATPLAALAINPMFCGVLWSILTRRVAVATSASNPLEFAYTLRGLSCLWVNEYWAARHSFVGRTVLWLSVLLSALALLGFASLAWRCIRAGLAKTAAPDHRRISLLALGMLALGCVPIALLIYSRQYPYQFCKLMASVSPLLVVGVAHAWEWLPASSWRRRLGAVSLGLLLATAFIGTSELSLAATKPAPLQPRSLQHVTLDASWREALNKLSSLRDKNIVLATGSGIHHNGWFAYAARHNNVRLVNPALMDGTIISRTPVDARSVPVSEGLVFHPNVKKFRFSMLEQLVDLQSMPADELLFTSDLEGNQVRVEGDHTLLWSNDHFQLWQLGPGPYSVRRIEK